MVPAFKEIRVQERKVSSKPSLLQGDSVMAVKGAKWHGIKNEAPGQGRGLMGLSGRADPGKGISFEM